ncbi:MAG: pyridoxal 5'-phosphate synthase glutaminase subunit PdxT [Dehalococcoidia bacterium]|nr:pyridoxal 5'-phosphate synthase glutaminase subunit PdxT [Dehalococcoidia bacterium]MDZ4246055.1 pyridoxal 5'-phosphate synthase glutaminase subunit PdxT [Dehalococcoidia bacterium]
MKIGVLALQGAFIEHISVLQSLGVESVEVRLPGELKDLDGLIIPGGESTTITRLVDLFQLREPLFTLASDSFPIFGTCAGMIVLAGEAVNGSVNSMGVLDIKVKRNAFGRQVDSFQVDLEVPVLGKEPFPAVFIRAPYIEKMGRDVQLLARLKDGPVVAARQGKILVTSFHPELTRDNRFHRYFLDIVKGKG